MSAMSASGPEPRKRATPLQVAKAVLSGFFGVRRRAHHESVKLTPVQVIIAGFIAAAIFVATLLLVVTVVLGRVA